MAEPLKLQLSKRIFNDAFYPMLFDYSHRYEVYKGSAGSGKSHFISQKLIIKAINETHIINNYCFENIYISNNEEQLCKLEDFILLKTAGNTFIPWNASQADVQADDWVIV